MTAANKVTILRVALIPVFVILLLAQFKYSNILALFIFALASATDGVDGYLARKMNQVTTFGKFMDPLADKLLVTSAILVFVEWGQMPSWAAFIIIAREFAVTALRLVAVDNGIVIAAGTSGKIKTVSSMIAICLMLTGLHSLAIIPGLLTIDDIAVTVMLVTTVWSGIMYFKNNAKLLQLK